MPKDGTSAPPTNGLSIANVATSSHSYDLDSPSADGSGARRRGLQAAPEEVREPLEHASLWVGKSTEHLSLHRFHCPVMISHLPVG